MCKAFFFSKMVIFGLFLCVLLYSQPGRCSHICPKTCICEQATSVQCFRAQAVPPVVSNDVKKIHLGYNHLKELKVRDFSGLPGLEEVVLSSGGIEQIDADVFRSHVSLRTLDLQKNKLRQLPRGLPSGLEILRLGHNRIHSLQESALEGLKKLRVLNLRNNQISTLRSNPLASLEKLECLNLDGNEIESIHSALDLPFLNSLSAASNRISSVSPTFFSSLQLLKTLDLSSNRLTKVPRDLPRSLVQLNLDRNRIRSLRSRDMSRLHNLISLSVSSNRLVSVDGGLRLPNLSVCELAGNRLRTLPARLTSKLQKLDCRQNDIREVTFQQLAGMKLLKHLFLENNSIQHFEANALRNCIQLTSLALEQNLLSAVPHGLPETLVRLDLKGNNIDTIHERELKPLRRLQVLNLRNNKLSGLPALNLPKLKVLYLDGNPWQCSCELIKVKKALLAKDVEIRPDFCSEPVRESLDEWRAYVLARDICEKQTRDLLLDGQTERMDNEEYDDYDL
ncbi:nephrocan-like [Puntigrus tetrazona]|uniref:nephrocan-like n=1 Tax=Puntigrus tetrazona TaxID=1606681 RepID=UPI001C8965D4|nr:nephrocan-like [Puntigrus tetrazona]